MGDRVGRFEHGISLDFMKCQKINAYGYLAGTLLAKINREVARAHYQWLCSAAMPFSRNFHFFRSRLFFANAVCGGAELKNYMVFLMIISWNIEKHGKMVKL